MLMTLRPPDWAQWQALYRPGIRTMVWWEELRKPEPRVVRVYDPWPLFYPWWRNRDEWRSVKPREPRRVPSDRFRGDAMIIVPAVKVAGRGYLILDGAHRVRDHRPRWLAVDALVVTRAQEAAFADLVGAWRRRR